MNEILDENLTVNKPRLILAGKGSRLGNFIIDIIGFYVLIFIQSLILENFLLGFTPDWFVVYFYIFYLMYYTAFEHFFGKTPGKFLTNTTVVKKNGRKPNFVNLLGRNLARFIPFDGFSYLFLERGWHDQVSDTYVVFDKKN